MSQQLPEPLLLRNEVAELLNVSPWQVGELRRRGRLAAVNVSAGDGRPTWRYRRSEITKFLRNRATSTRKTLR